MIADIPGLIEGAAEGAGLGHQFLRHLARTRLLLHIIDVAPFEEDADPARDAKSIAAELKKFDPALYRKPRWLVLNKIDMLPAEEREAAAAKLVRRLRWRGPSLHIGAHREGCRELSFAVMKFLNPEGGMGKRSFVQGRQHSRHEPGRGLDTSAIARWRTVANFGNPAGNWSWSRAARSPRHAATG